MEGLEEINMIQDHYNDQIDPDLNVSMNSISDL